jgi:hypothetical protein
MQNILYLFITAAALFLIYMAAKPKITFPYYFVILVFVGELLQNHITERAGGYAAVTRLLYLISVVVFIYRCKIKTIGNLKLLLFYLLFMYIYSEELSSFVFAFLNMSTILLGFSAGTVLIWDRLFLKRLLNVSNFLIIIAAVYLVMIRILGIRGGGYSDEFSTAGIASTNIYIISFASIIVFIIFYSKSLGRRRYIDYVCLITSIVILVLAA